MSSYTETLTGTYEMSDQETAITLKLRQDELGTLSGTLTDNAGMALEVAGRVQGEMGVGVCTDDKGGVYFEARPDGALLHFSMIEPDSANMPDYNTAREIVFTKRDQRLSPEDIAGLESGEDTYELMRHLAGTWICDTGGKRIRAIFSPDGSYRYHQESGTDGSPAHHYGDPDAVRSDYADDSGEWDVHGDRERGIITLISARGGTGRVEYQVRKENGQPAWDKYWFNRELFGKR